MRDLDPRALAALGLLLSSGPAAAATPAPRTDGGATAPATAEESIAASLAGAPDSPEGGSFTYYYVTGATLEARESTTEWDYSATGCKYTIGGTDRILNTELAIPDGSTIKYLRIFYNDTSAADDVLGYITRYDTGTSTEDLVSVSSTGSSGVGTALSAEITHEVNNFGFGYVLIGWPDVSSPTVQICGLRVAYFAPLIFADGFETGDTVRWSLTAP